MSIHDLAAWCRQFSPVVGVGDAQTPESVFLDITGLEHLFGSESSLAEKIAHELGRRRLNARVAVADTLGAAWAVTHGEPSDFRFQILDFRVILVPPGQVAAALRPLPVAALRLPDEVLALLQQLGIFQIGQLERLPRAELSARFGPRLLARWDQATGRLAEPIPAYRLPPRFRTECCLEHPTTHRDAIAMVFQSLIERLACELREHGAGALQLVGRLRGEDGATVEITVGLFQPAATAAHLVPLVQLQLDRLQLPGPISAVCVEATVVAAQERRQQELFGEDAQQRNAQALAGLIDRLSSRLGACAVLRPRLLADAQPELAYRYDPLVGPAVRRRRPPPSGELPPRPLRLFSRPVPLETMEIVSATGPERIETGWWRGRLVGRDYYRVETATGHWLWVFHRLCDDRWFLHGAF